MNFWNPLPFLSKGWWKLGVYILWNKLALWTLSQKSAQILDLSIFPLKPKIMRQLGTKQTATRFGLKASGVIFVLFRSSRPPVSWTMIPRRADCEMCPKCGLTALKTNISPPLNWWQRDWRPGDSGGQALPVTSLVSFRVSVRHPELSVYPVFAAWDYEKLLLTLKIIFSKPHRSFFKWSTYFRRG